MINKFHIPILSAIDDERLRRYNSWVLTEEQKKDPKHIWQCFEAQLEGSAENLCAACLHLDHFRQEPSESLDNFVTRCRQKALRCKYKDHKISERIIEQIIVSTPMPEFQQFLLQ